MAKVAFKKWYRCGWASPLAGLIAFWTGGKYSHVELMMSETTGFSASAWDNEIRTKEIDFYNGKWDIVETTRLINHSKVKESLGKSYDYLAIAFWEFLPLKIQVKDRSYCSEVVSCALNIDPCQNDPVKLYNILINEQDLPIDTTRSIK